MARSAMAAIVVTSERRRLPASNSDMKTTVYLATEAKAGNENVSWKGVTATLHRSAGHRHRSEDARFD